MKQIILLMCVLQGTLVSYVQADCYPGDTAYTQIVQEIYHGVTSDNIKLSAHGPGGLYRSALCHTLTSQHNIGLNPGQPMSNSNFLGTTIPQYACENALTYTTGYNSLFGWQTWAGHHSGTWYGYTQQFEDNADWHNPITTYDSQHTYGFQKVQFNSQDRINNCVTPDMTGATCRFGWNQSGLGVRHFYYNHTIVQICMHANNYNCVHHQA